MLVDCPIKIPFAPSTSATNYNGYQSVGAWGTDATVQGNCVGGDATGRVLKDWTVNSTNDPSPGSYLFELCTNVGGVLTTTGLQVTIGAGTKTGNSGDSNFVVLPGQILTVRCTPSSSPASLGFMNWNMYEIGVGQMLMTSITGGGNVPTDGSVRYLAPNSGGQSSLEGNEPRPSPHAFTMQNMFIATNQDLGSGKKIKVTAWKNSPSGGFYQLPGTAQSLTATITGNGSNGISANDTTHTVSYSQFDMVYFKIEPDAGIPSNTKIWIGYQCVPAVDGYCLTFQEIEPPAAGTTNFTWPVSSIRTTETDAQVYSYPATMLNLVACVSSQSSTYVDVENGKTVTVTFRVNASSSGCPTATATGAGGLNAPQISDLSTSKKVVRGDLINMQTTNTGGISGLYGVHMGMTRWIDQSVLYPTGLTQISQPYVPKPEVVSY